MRLRADSEDEIALDAETGAVMEIVSRPMDLALETVGELHVRPLKGKVIEIFRIDRGKFRRHQLLGQVAHGGRRRGAGIAPAAESEDQCRPSERRDSIKAERVRCHRFLFTTTGPGYSSEDSLQVSSVGPVVLKLGPAR